ncbi:hypothetical protein [Salegentibacter mishustinae]|uniref:Uncharacterized protein n=1 Tax=Salegentibacter mishustinae TaxID=270918 RepID=A0A0Q9ZMY0_9FLAO|nr:hypothetical protein [Salegentibacter mishustinae]KRG30353.1 hypothetical protein APR42_00380 [Salegentibacter mishustinae]PNW23249.1 hypothetical protein APB85_00375 [Salegentibacter mishustinae]PZX66308.1 hypothetical protein LY54_00700 [Salegentibacter mishustinae]GGW81752.1 hypothetical protein GCM10008086_06720 [Salegentibacter mishustinae]
MKKIVLYYFLLFAIPVISQVGIGTTEPGAQLDIVATDNNNPSKIDGILIPRIKKFPSQDPGIEQHGMLIFLSEAFNNFPAGFYYWHQQEGEWKSIVSDAKAANFYEPNTTESPGNINDNLFRKGNISIGTENIESKLQIAINPGDPGDIKKGLQIDNNNPEKTRNTYGIEITNRSKTDAIKYGLKLNVSTDGEAERYGIYNVTSKATGSRDMYGIYNKVGRTEGASSDNYGIFTEIGSSTGRGNIYGIYARAEGNSSSRVFAGYFAGSVGIGKTPAVEYTLPDSRGEENQILVSDNSGKVNWKHNHTRNYISTGSQSGTYIIGDEVYFLRINPTISSITIPDASANKGREIVLISKGSSTTALNFVNGDTLDDIQDNSINSISNGEVFTILSIGTRWLLLRK